MPKHFYSPSNSDRMGVVIFPGPIFKYYIVDNLNHIYIEATPLLSAMGDINMNRTEKKRYIQKQRHRLIRFVIKMTAVFIIINFTLPFYGGATTSALGYLPFVEHRENQPAWGKENSSPNFQEVASSDAEMLPVIEPDPTPSPKPSLAPTPTPAATESPVFTGEPSSSPSSTPSSTPEAANTPEPGEEEDSGEGPFMTPAEAGAFLQKQLNKAYRHNNDKVAYLTFDDGPTPSITNKILDILEEEGIKATFFIIGSYAEKNPHLIKRAYDEGHGIGNHTYSHKFNYIYKKPQNLVGELVRTEKILQGILGEDKIFRVIRFPGGSFGEAMEPFREAVNEAGFGYIDWNSINGDAESVVAKPADQQLARLKETVNGQSGLIVLMHDAINKDATVDALPEIIKYLRKKGYRFELIPGVR